MREPANDAGAAYLALTARERRQIAGRLAPSVAPLTDPRFDDADIERGCAHARQQHPNEAIYLLTDPGRDGPAFAGVTRITSIDEAAQGPAVFVLALNDDDRLAAAASALARRPRTRYYGVPVYYPTGRYAHRDPVARRVLIEESELDVPKFNLDDFEGLMQAIAATRRTPGSYVEIGVFQGRSARAAVRYMRAAGVDRRVLLVDTFEGFDYPEAESSTDAVWTGTHGETNLDDVRAFVDGGDRVEYAKLNIIHQDLPPEHDPIAVCNIDVDMYEAVLAAAERVAPRMAVGGVMVFEDAGHTPALAGALAALTEFLETEAARAFVPICLRSGQTLLVRVARGPV